MIRAGLLMLVLCTPGLANAESAAWEASVVLQAVDDPAASLPAVLVPKQAVLMKVTVWMPKGENWYPRYPDWDMQGATLTKLLMLSPSIERDNAGFSQRGATQNYVLTPIDQGELVLTPQTIKVHPDQPDSPEPVFDPLRIQVALPAGADGLEHFLPASSLQLTQAFQRQLANGEHEDIAPDALAGTTLAAGDLLERRIVVHANGIQASQIPALQADAGVVDPQSEATDLNNYGDFTGGELKLTWLYAPQAGGKVTVQPVTLHWYDLTSRMFRTARLPGGEVRSAGGREDNSVLALGLVDRLSIIPGQTLAAGVSGFLALVALVSLRRRLWQAFKGACRWSHARWQLCKTARRVAVLRYQLPELARVEPHEVQPGGQPLRP